MAETQLSRFNDWIEKQVSPALAQSSVDVSFSLLRKVFMGGSSYHGRLQYHHLPGDSLQQQRLLPTAEPGPCVTLDGEPIENVALRIQTYYQASSWRRWWLSLRWWRRGNLAEQRLLLLALQLAGMLGLSELSEHVGKATQLLLPQATGVAAFSEQALPLDRDTRFKMVNHLLAHYGPHLGPVIQQNLRQGRSSLDRALYVAGFVLQLNCLQQKFTSAQSFLQSYNNESRWWRRAWLWLTHDIAAYKRFVTHYPKWQATAPVLFPEPLTENTGPYIMHATPPKLTASAASALPAVAEAATALAQPQRATPAASQVSTSTASEPPALSVSTAVSAATSTTASISTTPTSTVSFSFEHAPEGCSLPLFSGLPGAPLAMPEGLDEQQKSKLQYHYQAFCDALNQLRPYVQLSQQRVSEDIAVSETIQDVIEQSQILLAEYMTGANYLLMTEVANDNSAVRADAIIFLKSQLSQYHATWQIQKQTLVTQQNVAETAYQQVLQCLAEDFDPKQLSVFEATCRQALSELEATLSLVAETAKPEDSTPQARELPFHSHSAPVSPKHGQLATRVTVPAVLTRASSAPVVSSFVGHSNRLTIVSDDDEDKAMDLPNRAHRQVEKPPLIGKRFVASRIGLVQSVYSRVTGRASRYAEVAEKIAAQIQAAQADFLQMLQNADADLASLKAQRDTSLDELEKLHQAILAQWPFSEAQGQSTPDYAKQAPFVVSQISFYRASISSDIQAAQNKLRCAYQQHREQRYPKTVEAIEQHKQQFYKIVRQAKIRQRQYGFLQEYEAHLQAPPMFYLERYTGRRVYVQPEPYPSYQVKQVVESTQNESQANTDNLAQMMAYVRDELKKAVEAVGKYYRDLLLGYPQQFNPTGIEELSGSLAALKDVYQAIRKDYLDWEAFYAPVCWEEEVAPSLQPVLTDITQRFQGVIRVALGVEHETKSADEKAWQASIVIETKADTDMASQQQLMTTNLHMPMTQEALQHEWHQVVSQMLDAYHTVLQSPHLWPSLVAKIETAIADELSIVDNLAMVVLKNNRAVALCQQPANTLYDASRVQAQLPERISQHFILLKQIHQFFAEVLPARLLRLRAARKQQYQDAVYETYMALFSDAGEQVARIAEQLSSDGWMKLLAYQAVLDGQRARIAERIANERILTEEQKHALRDKFQQQVMAKYQQVTARYTESGRNRYALVPASLHHADKAIADEEHKHDSALYAAACDAEAEYYLRYLAAKGKAYFYEQMQVFAESFLEVSAECEKRLSGGIWLSQDAINYLDQMDVGTLQDDVYTTVKLLRTILGQYANRYKTHAPDLYQVANEAISQLPTLQDVKNIKQFYLGLKTKVENKRNDLWNELREQKLDECFGDYCNYLRVTHDGAFLAQERTRLQAELAQLRARKRWLSVGRGLGWAVKQPPSQQYQAVCREIESCEECIAQLDEYALSAERYTQLEQILSAEDYAKYKAIEAQLSSCYTYIPQHGRYVGFFDLDVGIYLARHFASQAEEARSALSAVSLAWSSTRDRLAWAHRYAPLITFAKLAQARTTLEACFTRLSELQAQCQQLAQSYLEEYAAYTEVYDMYEAGVASLEAYRTQVIAELKATCHDYEFSEEHIGAARKLEQDYRQLYGGTPFYQDRQGLIAHARQVTSARILEQNGVTEIARISSMRWTNFADTHRQAVQAQCSSGELDEALFSALRDEERGLDTFLEELRADEAELQGKVEQYQQALPKMVRRKEDLQHLSEYQQQTRDGITQDKVRIGLIDAMKKEQKRLEQLLAEECEARRCEQQEAQQEIEAMKVRIKAGIDETHTQIIKKIEANQANVETRNDEIENILQQFREAQATMELNFKEDTVANFRVKINAKIAAFQNMLKRLATKQAIGDINFEADIKQDGAQSEAQTQSAPAASVGQAAATTAAGPGLFTPPRVSAPAVPADAEVADVGAQAQSSLAVTPTCK
jgi:hypothetical protein